MASRAGRCRASWARGASMVRVAAALRLPFGRGALVLPAPAILWLAPQTTRSRAEARVPSERHSAVRRPQRAAGEGID